jgi:hypothetical protein
LIIDIYTSATNGSKYLSVAKGTRIENLSLPADSDKDILSLSPFKTRLTLDLTKPHPTLDYAEVIAQIEAQGYAIHGAKTTLVVGSTNK